MLPPRPRLIEGRCGVASRHWFGALVASWQRQFCGCVQPRLSNAGRFPSQATSDNLLLLDFVARISTPWRKFPSFIQFRNLVGNLPIIYVAELARILLW